MDGLAGPTVIDTNAAGVTVTGTEAVTEPEAA
jgi:hypothetical protein